MADKTRVAASAQDGLENYLEWSVGAASPMPPLRFRANRADMDTWAAAPWWRHIFFWNAPRRIYG